MKKIFLIYLLMAVNVYIHGQNTPVGKSIEYYIKNIYNKSSADTIQVYYEDEFTKSKHQKKVLNYEIIELDSTLLEGKVLFVSMQKNVNEIKIIILEKFYIKNNNTDEKNIYLSASMSCIFYLKKDQWICKKCKSDKF